jgi:thymidylate kinase
MLIILEGPDGAGKTTLAREIAAIISEHAEVDVLRAGPLTEHPLDAYEVPLANYRPGMRHVVCDRWHLGEAIYPAILNRKTVWDGAIAEHIHLFLKSRGACVVVINPKVSELKTRVKIRGDDLIQVEHLDYISSRYNKLPARHITMRYDAQRLASPREIVNTARALHLDASILNPFETYVGSTNPGVLLFGDERAAAARRKQPDLPAFAPYGATSGHFLLHHIRRNHLLSDVGIANACDTDDPYALWRALNRPAVVTLGRRAHERLTRLGMHHGAVPHPQFIRRFYFRHGDVYVQAIHRAMRRQEDMSTWRPS